MLMAGHGQTTSHTEWICMFTAGYEKIAHHISWYSSMIPERVGLICAVDLDNLSFNLSFNLGFNHDGLDSLRLGNLCVWIRLGLGIWIWLGC